MDPGDASVPSSTAHHSASEFEAAIYATDDTVRRSHKRVRESLLQTRRLLRKPRGEPFPFHAEVDTLEASLQATTAITGATHPGFDLQSDPRRIFEWVRDVQIEYGHECREEGRSLEREEAALTRLPAELALELMKLITQANKILQAPRT